MEALFNPSKLLGSIDAPQSKSIAIRLIFSSLLGRVNLRQLEYSRDVEAAIRAISALGASRNEGVFTAGKIPKIAGEIDLGGSGTVLRMLVPILSCLGVEATLTGDESLRKRPLGVVYDYLTSNGIKMSSEHLPLKISGKLDIDHVEISGSESSQYISGFIYGLLLKGGGTIDLLPPVRSSSYIRMTCTVLNDLGADIRFTGEQIVVSPLKNNLEYTGRVPGDFLLSSFYAIGALLTGGSVEISNLIMPDWSSGDSRIVQIIKESTNSGTLKDGTWNIKSSDSISQFSENVEDSPDMAVSLAALACGSEGKSEISGIELLRIKESDRIRSISDTLENYGCSVEIGNTMKIACPAELSSGTTESWEDHRITMLGSLLSLKNGGVVKGTESVSKSNPRFFSDLEKLGGDFRLR